MTSRVTVMPKLESGDDSPAKGRRHGTRARAAAKWAARSDTSNAAIGLAAVCTSGRSPMATGVTLPRPARNVKPDPVFDRHTLRRVGSTQRAWVAAGPAVVPYAG